MLQDKHVEKLLQRFPYLIDDVLRRELQSADPAEAGRASGRLLESLLRFLSALFLTQAMRRGAGDERLTQFVDEELDKASLGQWIEFQKVLLEERRVPFEEVFSLDFKRRDLLLLLLKRYLDYLEVIAAQLKAETPRPGEVGGILNEFVEFLATYFRSDLIEGEGDAPLGVRLVNKDRDEVFGLYPILRGPLSDLQVLSGLVPDGIAYVSLASHERREAKEPECIERLGEVCLKVGAYRQAMAVFERLARARPGARDHLGAAYATHCHLGMEAFRKGRHHQAVLEFDKAMRLRADLHQLHYSLALAHARLENFPRATQILLRLIEENPGLDRAHELLGDLYQMKGDPVAARRMYDKAYLANPYSVSVEAKRRRLGEAATAGAGAAAVGAPASAPASASAAAPAGEARKPAAEGDGTRVHDLLVDLTREAALGRFHAVVGRETEIDQIIEVLCCQSRSNPILIGEPGVGKTAVVEELASRLNKGLVPKPLRGKKLYLMSVATLLAGAKFRGQFEERVLALIQTLKTEGCILFIDDIHTIVNSGLSKGGTLDTSSLLKPALVRGEIQAIGATTYDEYRLNFEKDPSLVRSFQIVEIEEPSPEWMREILALHTARLAQHHGVKFEECDYGEIVRLVKVCLRERRLPDIAINVFDRSAVRVRLKQARDEERLPPVSGRAEGELPVVRRDDIVEVIAEMSGVPVARLSQSEAERFLNMERLVCDRVVGQDDAVHAVAQVMRTVKLDLDLHTARPDGVFLFVGPSGVGKTELARSLAEFLFGDEDKMIRIDMSEYMEKISSSRLIGTAPGYVGYNDQNQLTDQVRKSPYSVILLDEIEKADSQMLNLFLQVFDAGRLTDGKGRTVHFDNTTIIMTSNIGTHLFSQARAGYGESRKGQSVGRGELMKEVKRFFPPEFLNRIDEVVFFRQLDENDLKRIAAVQLRGLTARLQKQGTDLVLADPVYELLVREGASPEFGARNLARTIRRRILDPLAMLALNSPWNQVTRVVVTARDAHIEVALTVGGARALETVELTAAGESDFEAAED